jgi:hypothetical protein
LLLRRGNRRALSLERIRAMERRTSLVVPQGFRALAHVYVDCPAAGNPDAGESSSPSLSNRGITGGNIRRPSEEML